MVSVWHFTPSSCNWQRYATDNSSVISFLDFVEVSEKMVSCAEAKMKKVLPLASFVLGWLYDSFLIYLLFRIAYINFFLCVLPFFMFWGYHLSKHERTIQPVIEYQFNLIYLLKEVSRKVYRYQSILFHAVFVFLGLTEYQEAYSPYPNAHLCLRYVIEVGKVIFLDDDLDPGEMKDSEPQERSHFTNSAGSHAGRYDSMFHRIRCYRIMLNNQINI